MSRCPDVIVTRQGNIAFGNVRSRFVKALTSPANILALTSPAVMLEGGKEDVKMLEGCFADTSVGGVRKGDVKKR